jgi:DNA polymerase-3 subunit epsilon
MDYIPLYYDTETTGTKAEQDAIIELAVFDPINNRTFCELINPGFPIPPEASAIHNITDLMVKDAPTFKVVAEKFLEFCPSNAILIAHNNDAFDRPFLESSFKRAGIEIPSFLYIDTLKWARKYRPDLPRHSLQFLREVYGFPANQAHRALDDVYVLHQVFSVMIDDLPMHKVLKLLAEKKAVTRMPFGKHQGKQLSEVPKNYLLWLLSSGALDKPDNASLKDSLKELNLLPN